MLWIGHTPLGLMIRPAARIIRELPPSLTTYRVAVYFHAGPLAPLTIVWSTGTAESKKPIGERALGLVAALCSATPRTDCIDEARSPMGSRRSLVLSYDGLPGHRYVNYKS